MKRITAQRVEAFTPTKHRRLLLINEAAKKSCIFDVHTGRIIALPSSSDEMREAAKSPGLPSARHLGFLAGTESQKGYSIYSLNDTDFERIAAHALLATSEIKHFDELVNEFVKSKSDSTSLVPA